MTRWFSLRFSGQVEWSSDTSSRLVLAPRRERHSSPAGSSTSFFWHAFLFSSSSSLDGVDIVTMAEWNSFRCRTNDEDYGGRLSLQGYDSVERSPVTPQVTCVSSISILLAASCYGSKCVIESLATRVACFGHVRSISVSEIP